ncbi:hypothetical protein L3Q82_005392 [Scortum barcoo]|uniref:Uncharacterized protein n=1 Tax=Scortum barcoo TaxID=214431 RepID=A0ACB8VB26_9TELE|nr:hypothetical protein L3Q82_005392 [Scortum barcoo]
MTINASMLKSGSLCELGVRCSEQPRPLGGSDAPRRGAFAANWDAQRKTAAERREEEDDRARKKKTQIHSGALKDTLGLQLVGPFEILAGAHKKSKNPQPNLHLHWRYFYDPPEFQTILLGSEDSQHHIGYYRDTPDSLPSFVGENEAKKGYTIAQMGDNVFAAVLLHLLKRRKERGVKKAGGDALDSLEAQLRDRAETLGLSLEQKTKGMKQRDKKVVTKTFHGAGIVVPVDNNDVGYRELPETDAGLKKICKAIAEARNDEERVKAFGPLQEMITFVQFANDECDYGMGYELGIDLFCFGSHIYHPYEIWMFKVPDCQ